MRGREIWKSRTIVTKSLVTVMWSENYRGILIMLEVQEDYVTMTLLFGQETHMTLLVRDRI